MKEGYDLELTRMASSRVSVPVIASGGAGDEGALCRGFRGSGRGGGCSRGQFISLWGVDGA